MALVFGLVFGAVWLFFWLRGGVFAAGIAFLACMAFLHITDHWPETPFLIGLFVVPWIPLGLWSAMRAA